jgi:plasmid stabilization system protein ParE
VRLLPATEDDLESILDFLYAESPKTAIGFLEKFEEVKDRLQEFPHISRVPENLHWNRSGYRYYVMGNYIIYYKIEEEAIMIFRIFHGSQDYESILNS